MRNHVMALTIGSLVLLHAIGATYAATVTASVDRAEVHVGEPIELTLRIDRAAHERVELEPIAETIGTFNVTQPQAAQPTVIGDAVTEEYTLLLRQFSTGSQTIPGLAATTHDARGGEQRISSAPIVISVVSVLPEHWAEEDIRDIKGLVRVGKSHWWLWLLGGSMIAAAMAGGLWWSRTHRPIVAGPPPAPPHERALTALAALELERLPAQQRYEEYYVRVSSIARQYVEERFGLRAPEMTTEEFLQSAARAAQLSPQHRAALQPFLVHCDMVKFARYQPSITEADDALAAARIFITDTRPHEPVMEVTS